MDFKSKQTHSNAKGAAFLIDDIIWWVPVPVKNCQNGRILLLSVKKKQKFSIFFYAWKFAQFIFSVCD